MSYAQDYVDALAAESKDTLEFADADVVGEIGADDAAQPHIAVFLELAGGRYIGTTAGLSARSAPLPVDEGFQYFELIALTPSHSPGLLRILSSLGSFMLATADPMSYSTKEMLVDWNGVIPQPRPFLPYQTIVLARDVTFILLPRWRFSMPDGRPLEVVEVLPISSEQRAELREMPLEQREAWVAKIPDRMGQWEPLVHALKEGVEKDSQSV